MKQSIVSFLFVMILGATLQAQIKSPSEFLPNYGKQITFYHQTEAYFGHLVKESSFIKHQVYGQTNEERNLNAMNLQVVLDMLHRRAGETRAAKTLKISRR